MLPAFLDMFLGCVPRGGDDPVPALTTPSFNFSPPKLVTTLDSRGKKHLYVAENGNEFAIQTLSQAVSHKVVDSFLKIHPDVSEKELRAAENQATQSKQYDDVDVLIELRNKNFPEGSAERDGKRSPESVTESLSLVESIFSDRQLDFFSGYSEKDQTLIMNLCGGDSESLQLAFTMIANMSIGSEEKCSIPALHCAQRCLLHLKGEGKITEAAYNRGIANIAYVLNFYPEYQVQQCIPDYHTRMDEHANRLVRVLQTHKF